MLCMYGEGVSGKAMYRIYSGEMDLIEHEGAGRVCTKKLANTNFYEIVNKLANKK
jgi:hypothetical protein